MRETMTEPCWTLKEGDVIEMYKHKSKGVLLKTYTSLHTLSMDEKHLGSKKEYVAYWNCLFGTSKSFKSLQFDCRVALKIKRAKI